VSGQSPDARVSRRPRPAILAADVGNSKTDLVLVDAAGAVLAALRGQTASHQAVGPRTAAHRLRALAAAAAESAGLPPDPPFAEMAVLCAAGADTRRDSARLRRGAERIGLGRTVLVRNDADAVLRAGSPAGWGVAVICGAGVNCLGVAPDGRAARLAALGAVTGDRGGGYDVGLAGLGAAVRGRDGRGPRTVLERTLPPLLGARRPVDLARAIDAGAIPEARLGELAPAVFAAAGAGDAVAREIIDGLADELARMALAAIRRLGLLRREVPVILAGGVFRTSDAAFHERLAGAILRTARRARIERLAVPPVSGAVLLGFDARSADPAGPRPFPGSDLGVRIAALLEA
jgi:N-acetylglucosamine kinase-like BadF-type ATPase